MIICLDSMICVWGIKNRQMIIRNTILIMQHICGIIDEQKWKVIIPTVVIAEILMVEPEERYQEILDTITKNFIVAEFDIRAATKYAQILNKNYPTEKLAKEEVVGREKMKMTILFYLCISQRR